METETSVAKYLVSLAADLRTGKPILSVLDDLEEALREWRVDFPEDE